MQELDFSHCKTYPKAYNGANGKKIAILYKGELYMLKFATKLKQIQAHPNSNAYSNSCFCEYIACQILKTLGLDTQETLLGKFQNKIVVACKDFTKGYDFFDFASLKNSVIDSQSGGYDTNLDEILFSIENQTQFDIKADEIYEFFWDMFIADSLIGNFDRHNGNWGFLVDQTNQNCKIAPIFDCGSSLYPKLSEEQFLNIANSQEEVLKRVYNFPNSAIKQNDIKINMYEFLTSTKDENCLKSLEKIANKINQKEINNIIENTPYISNNHKFFLKTMINARKTWLIDKALRGQND